MKINKKRLIILLIVIAVIVAIIIGIVIHNNNNKEDNKKESSSKITLNIFEHDIEKNLRSLAIDFYENFYWPQVTKKGTNKKILENYKKTGKLVNGQTNEACDREKTKVIITPEEPYDKDDYRIETIISCGLEEK